MKREKMDEDKLNAFLDSELRRTIGYGFSGDEIAEERRRNLEYYLNRPLGDEEEGRSRLQASDVQDVVEALLPDTLAPFISSDKTVEFEPTSKEDVKIAELAGAYINHIFAADNDGMLIDYTWQKDGYISKNGFVFAEWAEREKMLRSMSKVYEPGLAELTEDPEIEILEVAGFDYAGNPIQAELVEAKQYDPETTCFEVDFRRTWKEGRVNIRNIPPEYVLVSNTATSEEDATLIGWQEEVTISQLREEGYPKDKVDKLSQMASEREFDSSGERNAREQAQGGVLDDEGGDTFDPAARKVWRTVCWTSVDYDGDGKTELRKIVRAGPATKGGQILLNEEADWKPIVSFTPVPMPHQLFGRAVADQAIMVQEGNTALIRMIMDGTYHTVHPRFKLVDEEGYITEDTWDDLMLDIPGAPVRVGKLDAIDQLRDSPDLGAAYQLMEKLDRMRETRTPVTRQDQGVDANVLQDKTAQEARIQANATARKKELVLRLYAHARVRLFKLILRIIIKHQDKPRMLRLNNEWVNIDPRWWNADMDASPSVGLGTGTKEQRMQALMMIMNEQKGAIMAGLPIATLENLFNTYEALVQDSGLTTPERYFTKPPEQQGDPAAAGQEQQAQGEAKQRAQQEEAEKIEQAMKQAYEKGKAEGKAEIDMIKIQSNEKIKAAEIASKQQMHEQEIAADMQMKQMDAAVRQQQARTDVQPAGN